MTEYMIYFYPEAELRGILLLKMMGALIGKKEELDRLLRSLSVDSSKIRKILNWNPPFSMREGINETVKWYKNRDG